MRDGGGNDCSTGANESAVRQRGSSTKNSTPDWAHDDLLNLSACDLPNHIPAVRKDRFVDSGLSICPEPSPIPNALNMDSVDRIVGSCRFGAFAALTVSTDF